MFILKFENLAAPLRNDAVRPYYDILKRKRFSLLLKRIFDIVASLLLLLLLSPVFILLIVIIKVDSKGPAFYLQERITSNARPFKIIKFRTMITNADKIGPLVTQNYDPRITRVGRVLRKFRLDEFPQLINILLGQMTFVGTRPEVAKYVNCYSEEMYATLLLPAGVTSSASIAYRDEQILLDQAEDVDQVYVERILPEKMQLNLDYLEHFSLRKDFSILFETVKNVFFK